MNSCIGIVNLDENENKLMGLTGFKGISTMSIAGKYKVIDFAISNFINSGIDNVGIFTGKKSKELVEHLNNGSTIGSNIKDNGIRVFNYSDYKISNDDIHVFLENIEFFKHSKQEYVILTPSYMIAYINYDEILQKHKKNKNDITIVYKKVEEVTNKFLGCEELVVDYNNVVTSIMEIGDGSKVSNVNMEMYIMKTSLFIDIIQESITTGLYRKVKEYIKHNLENLKVGVFEFKGYLSCINSIDSYFNANKEMLDIKISKELFYKDTPIYALEKDDVPTYYSKESRVENSIVASGSYIEGKVENSIIGRNVRVKRGVIVRNSIIMERCVIESNTIVSNTIITYDMLLNGVKIGDRL